MTLFLLLFVVSPLNTMYDSQVRAFESFIVTLFLLLKVGAFERVAEDGPDKILREVDSWWPR